MLPTIMMQVHTIRETVGRNLMLPTIMMQIHTVS